MRGIKHTFVALLLMAAAGVGTYEFMLTDEAKGSLKRAFVTVRTSYEKLSILVDDLRGIVMEEDASLPNRERTQEQWRRLGY